MCSIASTSFTASSNAPSYAFREKVINIISVIEKASTRLRDILHDDQLKFVAIVAEQLFQVFTFILRADGSANSISLLQERLHHPNCDKSIGTRDENFCRSLNDNHFCSISVRWTEKRGFNEEKHPGRTDALIPCFDYDTNLTSMTSLLMWLTNC